MKSLTELFTRSGIKSEISGNPELKLGGMTTDSRAVKAGDLFIAMPGVVADGTRYIPDALRAGAVAIVMSSAARSDVLATVPVVRVEDVRATTAALATAFYTHKPRELYAVTGTDGKTSTADFVRQFATLLGADAASIGTLGLRSPYVELNAAFPANNTSPEPILLHQTLDALAIRGASVVAMEASSHGIDQKRLDGVPLTAAAFTNFGRDHLDYHGTLEAYFAAKARLLGHVLDKGKTAVLNRDDARYGSLAAICASRSIAITSFGEHAAADYRVTRLHPHVGGLSATVVVRGTEYTLELPLYGAFQLSNMLAAMGLLAAGGHSESALITLLPKLAGVPGRLEKIVTYNGAAVFVDYAHTPAALENILRTLRPHTENKLHVVFGCGGDRDRGKRPEMGAAAATFADRVVVTDDNPRSENPASIRAAVLAAAPNAIEIPERATAIARAVSELKPGDVLVVAGKGHETTQTIGNQVLPFYDADEIRKAAA